MEEKEEQEASDSGGARQVGKTWIMKEFGVRQFKNVAYVNFDRNSRMQRVFEGDFDIRSIIQAINIETKGSCPSRRYADHL